MAIVITGAMHLPVPTTTEPGPQYANDVNTCLTYLSNHTHDGSYNGGTPIDLSIQTCLGNLSINSNNLTNVRSIEFISQPSQLTGSQDVNSIYVNQNNLGFNNSNGIFVPITNGNTLAITTLSLTNFSIRLVSSSFVILSTDTYNTVDMNSIGGPFDGYLPLSATITPVASGRLFLFRDVGLAAGTNPITIHTQGADVFADGTKSTFILNTNGGYVGFYTDGSGNWFTFTQNTYSYETLNLTNSTLALNGSSYLNMNNGALQTFASGSGLVIYSGTSVSIGATAVFTGTGGIIVGSSGTVSLNSTNTFSVGTTTFNSSAILDVNGIASFSGTTTYGGTTTIGGTLSLVGTTTLYGAGATIASGGSLTTLSGGSQTFASGSTLSLAGATSITGATTIGTGGSITSTHNSGIISSSSNGIVSNINNGIAAIVPGAIRLKFYCTVVNTFPYTASDNDDYILVETYGISPPYTIYLPDPTLYPGRLIYVCDAIFYAATNHINVTTLAGTNVFYTLNSVATITLSTNGKSIGFVSSGTFWQPIGV